MPSSDNLNWDYVIKFVIVGDAAVGKSSLLVRLTDQRFLNNPDPTLGVEFGSKLIHVEEADKTVKLQCWDTAGSETFRSISRSYYRGAAGALIVYDASSRPSFESTRMWLNDVREYADSNLSCILVGNKIDLCEEGEESRSSAVRQITADEAQKWADEEGLFFTEASAKSGVNVDWAFEIVCRDIVRKIAQGQFADGKSAGVKNSQHRDKSNLLESDFNPRSSCCT